MKYFDDSKKSLSMYEVYRTYIPSGLIPINYVEESCQKNNKSLLEKFVYEIADRIESAQFKKRYKKLVCIASPSPDINTEFMAHFCKRNDTLYLNTFMINWPILNLLRRKMLKHVPPPIFMSHIFIMEWEIDFTRPEYKCLVDTMNIVDIYESIYRNIVYNEDGIYEYGDNVFQELFFVERTIDGGIAQYEILKCSRVEGVKELVKYATFIKDKKRKFSNGGRL